MKKSKRDPLEIVGNQDGSILMITMLVLVLVTLIGFSALKSTDTELDISFNDRCFKQNLYMAEAAVVEVGQLLEMEPDTANLQPATAAGTTRYKVVDAAAFDPLSESWDDLNSTASAVFPDGLLRYSVVFQGIAPGESLDMSLTSTLWQYAVFGRSEQCSGRLDIVVGYRKRY